MRLIDADAVKRKAQKVATESWKMKMTAPVETVLNQFIDWIESAPTIDVKPTESAHWIPFHKREPDAEEREYHPDWVWVWDCELPDDGQEILVSTGRFVWKDEWCDEGNEGSGLVSGDEIDDGWAWMPMPEPYKGETECD